MSNIKEYTFKPLLSLLVKGEPTQPHQKCEFYHYFLSREGEWQTYRRLMIFLFISFVCFISLVFLSVTKDPQIPVIVAIIGAITSIFLFCSLQWFKNESIFRFIVERCKTLLRRSMNNKQKKQYIIETEDKIENGRVS